MPLSICVYCASSDAIDGAFFDAARQLGGLIGRGGHTLIYGGGCIGLMGALALAVHEHGGRVVGVIPKSMVDKEYAYRDADELIVTDDIRQRKAIMDRRADAFVALPGGFGTLEELVEVLAHRQLRTHDRPVVIVNSNGFYDPLLSLFEHFIEQRFAKPRHRESYHVAADPAGALSFLET